MSEIEKHPLFHLLESIESLHQKRLLDIGSGPLQPMQDVFAELTSPELAAQQVVSLDKTFETPSAFEIPINNPDAAIKAAAENLPFDENSFDIVSMVSLVHILENNNTTNTALQETRRVLIPNGGLLLLSNIALTPKVGNGKSMPIKLLLNTRKHNQQIKKYKKQVEDAGFQVTEEWKSLGWGSVLANFTAKT